MMIFLTWCETWQIAKLLYDALSVVLYVSLPTTEPPPTLSHATDSFQSTIDTSFWVVVLVALEFDEEYVLEGLHKTRSAVDTGQVEIESSETAQRICQSSR